MSLNIVDNIFKNNLTCLLFLKTGSIFFEVKYRSSGRKGCAAQAVGLTKQRKICRVADYYRMMHHCAADTPIRFDVVAVENGRLEWIRDAFGYIGLG